ncbi:alpha/beta fold hydrolase [Thioclava sp. A2]|uniref:alpha/beta hydrolase n=1 Tax=Thioclava sp. FCG-A2 TaxID=3080562 RepID=UPI0029547566|nr:alpha/beta fold hydrolase [Thioclava sp. A2]MDV7270659.1 alpha/beta fold hydrolase [Thioclava sp. A2]
MLLRFLIVVVLLLPACAPRGKLVMAPADVAASRAVFVATTRAESETELFGSARQQGLTRARFDIAVPPDRAPGEISYPTTISAPNPRKDFLVAGQKTYPEKALFRRDLQKSLARNDGEAVVFVHGYNMNFAEGLYRVAQLGTDFNLPGVLVHYSWPSKAHVLGYAYDRDSALFARDGFATLLKELRASGARRIIIVGHSMGAALTMETLRQLRISGDSETISRIAAVVLISPDIDIDLFRSQAAKIAPLPQPFIIFTSKKDLALRLSARISGETDRLGSLDDVGRLADLSVTVIDTAAFSTGGGHFNVGDSPALIALLQTTGQVAAVLEGEQNAHPDLAAGVVLTVRNATQIVLAPLGG